MTRFGLPWTALLIAVAAALPAVTPAAGAASRYASAASRYASPSGSGGVCSQAAPCAVTTAIEGASAGDNIFIPGNLGDYLVNSPIHAAAAGIHIHGTAGRPRLIGSGSADLRLQGSSATAENLYMEGSGTVFALDGSGDSANNVIIKATASHACYLGGGATLTNSVCWAASTGDLAVETDGANTFRNDTFVGGTEAAVKAFGRSGVAGNDTLVNVIARAGPGGKDLEVDAQDDTADATISASHSNYATTIATGTPGRDHITGDGTNQTASPLFVNAPAGDFHEAVGSPTIDAGINDPANGSTDFDGQPRTQNGKTDIGADEFSAKGFTIEPRISCAFAGCKVILVKGIFGSAGHVVAEDDTGQARADGAAVASSTHKSLIKKLRKDVHAGRNTLKLSLTKTALKELHRSRKLRIKVRFTFTPTGGTSSSQVKALKVKLPGKKS